MTDLPGNVQTCGVKGHFAFARLSPGDADGVMDLVPVEGLVVTLTPSPTYLLDATATPPTVIVPDPLVLTTDSNGDLRDVDGNSTAYVIASDDPDLNPHDWTYTVSFAGTSASKFAAYSAAFPAGETIDLSLITPIPSALGVSVSVAQAAEAAAAAYAASAADARDDAVAATATKLDKATLGVNVRDFGATGNGTTSDVAAFDSMIAYLNTNGHLTTVKPITVVVPAGTYNVKAGGIRALTVSNISVQVSMDAVFYLQNGPVWTLGNSSTTIQNFWVTGGQPRTDPSDTLAATCSWVYAVNAAQVFVDGQRYLRCQMFKGVSNSVLSGITLSNFTGSGAPDRHWVEIDTSANPSSAAAGLYLVNGGGYAYVPPTNPAISPVAITAATQANPVQITAANHGFTTGDRVRHGGVSGMTQLNGVEATVTVVNSSTYTLDGVNGTGFSAYTSGGWAAELLWSYAYDSAVVGIKGHWDTARIVGGLYQHFPWLWSVESQGVVSYLFDENVVWDYGGKGRFNIALNGGSVSNINVNQGWHFCLNEDWIKITAPGAGSVTDITVRGHTLGMTGGHFIYDNLDKVLNLEVDGLRVLGMGRARVGTCYLLRPGATGNNNATIRRVRSENPGSYYTNGSTYLLPDVAIQCAANTRYTVENNEVQAATTHYSIPSTSSASGRLRMIRNNKTRLGGLPEYITTATATPPASTVAETNFTGLTKQISLYGGTMTAVAKNGTQIMSGAGPFAFDVLPGETWAVTYSATPTLVVSYKD